MVQIIRSILSLVVVFGFIGCGGNSNTTETTSTNSTNINKATFEISNIQDNTVEYDSVATFTIRPSSKPSANISVSLESSDENEGVVEPTELVFTPQNWDMPQTVKIIGRNRNVINYKQDYQIIISPTQSDDKRYDGVEIDDIQINGIELKLSKPTDLYSFISNIETTINLDTTYNSNKILSYSLLEKPNGMTIDADTGLIAWTASESAEGDSYDVKVKVTDGVLSDEISFSVDVENTMPLETQTNGNVISVTEENSNLNGLTVTILDSNNAPNIVIEKVEDSALGIIPNFVTKITDGFVIKNPINGNVKVRLPLSSLPTGTDLNYVSLYSLVSANGIEGKFWSPVSTRTDISNISGNPIVEISLPRLEGLFFISVEEPEVFNTESQKLSNLQVLAKTEISDINCTPTTNNNNGSLNYMLQYCKVLNSNSINIRVEKFGTSDTSTRWHGTTIEELIAWIVDAQEGFCNLDLSYDNNFTVRIHPLDVCPRDGREDNDTLGYVDSIENSKTLHITRKNRSKNIIKATSVHEYFHQAQSRSKISGKDLLIDGGRNKNWFIEGTAQWFEDYLYDSLDSYIFTEAPGQRILEAGLNGIRSHGGYQRFSFFKLLKSKCSDFDDVFKELLNIDKTSDPSGIINLSNELANASCNFGDQLGANKQSSLESALLYYQYATLYKNKISLLDSNENDNKFKFEQPNYIFSNWFNSIDDWLNSNNNLEHKLNIPQRIPPVGAFSFNIKPIQGVIPDNKEAVLKIKSDGNLTVSIVSPDEDFLKGENSIEDFLNGGNTIDAGNGTTDRHKWFHCEKECEFSYEFDDKMPKLFVSLVNPNTTKNVDDVNVTFDIVNKDIGEINATINFNTNTIDPNKKVFISLTKINFDKSAGVIERVKIDTSFSPFVYEFKNLEMGRYTTMLHSENNSTLYGDVKETKITKENPTAQVEHQLEMNYEEASTKFTESLVRGKWKVDSDTSNVTFNADTDKTISGLWSSYIWSVNDKGELELTYYLLGSPITTKILKIVGNVGGCYRVNATETNSYWHDEYKMCK